MSGLASISTPLSPSGRAPAPGVTARCRDYQRMASTLAWISAHFEEQPSLTDIASRAGTSPYHFQRLFSRWVGLSPKKYVQFLTLEHAKHSLAASVGRRTAPAHSKTWRAVSAVRG